LLLWVRSGDAVARKAPDYILHGALTNKCASCITLLRKQVFQAFQRTTGTLDFAPFPYRPHSKG